MLDFEGPNLNNIVGHIRANEIPQARIKFQRCTATDTTNWKQLLRTSGTWDTWFLGKIAPLKIHFKDIKKSKIGTIIFLEYSKPITKTNARKILASRAIQHTLKECEETLLPRLWRALDLFPVEKRKKLRARLVIAATQRFHFNPFRLLNLKIPFSPHLDKKLLITKLAKLWIEPLPLPQVIKTWMVENIKITLTKRRCIGDNLTNYAKHIDTITPICNCAKIQARTPGYIFPKHNGHIAFAAANYEGPLKHIMHQNCENVLPPSIGGDLNIVAKGLNEFEKKLHPKWKAEIENLSHNQWVDMLKTCYTIKPELGNCGNHKHVLKLKKHITRPSSWAPRQKWGAIVGMLPLHLPYYNNNGNPSW